MSARKASNVPSFGWDVAWRSCACVFITIAGIVAVFFVEVDIDNPGQREFVYPHRNVAQESFLGRQ
jgi:hypothetical protein